MFADTVGDQSWMINRCLVTRGLRMGRGRSPAYFALLFCSSAYSFESLAWYHGWDCILQGVCVHDRRSRVGWLRDGHDSVICHNMCLIPTVLSLLHPIHISLLARLKNLSDRQFLAIQLFDQPGIPHVPTIVASALWLRFSDPWAHSES